MSTARRQPQRQEAGPLIMAVGGQSRLAGHVAVALAAHLKWVRGNGLREPQGLQELADLFRAGASGGQPGTALDEAAELRDSGRVEVLLVSYDRAAAVLSCSTRQLKRLAAAGEIPTVRLGGLVRIRVADLEKFVAALTISRKDADAA